MSKFEDKITSILKTEKIKFVREKTFKDLHNGLYRYDFYLPELNVIIPSNIIESPDILPLVVL